MSAILKEKIVPDYNVEFTATSGWSKQWKDHCSLHNGEESGGSVSGGVKAAEKVLETLQKLTWRKAGKSNLPEQQTTSYRLGVQWALPPRFVVGHYDVHMATKIT